ncbi:hypothetical protein FA95DRAFT_1612765 [Auriscalpium vulgare]|uniref:Uncharacterized protein n=1 Tax=Auriscalpium vulgare TaxID=40419 RepID=A0ACB8R5Z0_9AGAM|nr:hypothetical protein FA95DRAFT_1612765 [Auriscalpium vulgare]
MFKFFARKPAAQDDSMAVDPPSPSKDVHQLRTPSPSDGTPATALLASPAPSLSPQPTPLDPQSLHSLLTAVPPKTLHTYTLAHLPSAPPPTLAALADFFATLTPPPRLHCARCHADFVDVENGDRACRVAHDDESAEVERVGRRAGEGAEYETLWGCCGRTVEGDGDQGPPDGWCYEGKHTTDVKRARFRADSTLTNDRLQSCLRLNCHGVRDTLPRSTRASKRPRPLPDADAEDDDASEGTEDSGMAEIAAGVSNLGRAKGKGKAPPKSKGKGKGKPPAQSDAEDSSVEASVRSAPAPTTSPAAKPRRRKPSAPSPRAPPRSKLAKSTTAPTAEDDHPMSDAAGRAPVRGRATKGRAEVVIRQTRSQSVGAASARGKSRARREREGHGAETADERERTDGEGKRKRRKLAAAPS